MNCPNCKQEIEDNSVFCEYCGTKIEQEQLANTNEFDSVKSSTKPWWKRKWVLPVSSVVLVAIVAVVLLNLTYIRAEWFFDAVATRKLADKYYDKGNYEKADSDYNMAQVRGDYYSAVVLACAELGWENSATVQYSRPGLIAYCKSRESDDDSRRYYGYKYGILFLERAVELGGDLQDNQINHWLGDLYSGDYGEWMTNKQKAIFYYQKALNNDPSDTYASSRLARLE